MKAVRPGSQGNEIVADELRLLARVSGVLSEISAQAVGSPDFDAELLTLRDQIAEAKPEDVAPLVEQMMRLSAIAGRYGKGRDLPVDPASPYFAHLRLDEEGKEQDVLIGKRGFIDRARKVQIVDWRNAPVSRIYYRYQEEDDYEEEFGDRVREGVVRARRNLSVEDGSLRRIGCPQGSYWVDDKGEWFESDPVRPPELSGGQGKAARPPVLQRGRLGPGGSRLGRGDARLRADKHLPDIAALIDRAQFGMITQPGSGLVVLQGGAGTGKTTVALHRIAYLNYQRPKLFRPERMIVVVPSMGMRRYVERVLPALGVRGVTVTTARQWFEKTRRRVMPWCPAGYSESAPAPVTRLKKHPVMLKLLDDYVAAQTREVGESVGELGDSDANRQACVEAWGRSAGRPLVVRIDELREWVSRERWSQVATQRAESTLRKVRRRALDVVSDWAELLTSRASLQESLETHCPGEFSASQLDQVVGWCSRQASAVQDAVAAGTDELDDGVEHVAADGRIEGADEALFDAEDDALLLLLLTLKRGRLRRGRGKSVTYEHVVVDEAQDLSAIELKVLIDTTRPRYSVTLAGDTAQRVVFDNAFSDWESLLARLKVPMAANTTLELGYRSTGEVMALARRLLGEEGRQKAPEATRSGAPVELLTFGSEGEQIATLAEVLRSLVLREPLASVALITRRAGQAQRYADALSRAEVPAVRWVVQQDFSFRPGVEVTDVYQVKGLEFDYAILLDVDAKNYPDTLESRHLLHIGATRAAYQLWLTCVGSASPLVPRDEVRSS